jgi:hypothetical protein
VDSSVGGSFQIVMAAAEAASERIGGVAVTRLAMLVAVSVTGNSVITGMHGATGRWALGQHKFGRIASDLVY